MIPQVATASVEQRMLAMVEGLLAELGRHLPAGAIRWEASLERDLGLGSLERVELLSRVESELGRSLPDSVLAEAGTLADILQAVRVAEGRPSGERALPAADVLAPAWAPESAGNLLEALHAHARANPERPHIHLRADDGAESTITYGTLARRACRVAAELARRGVGAGDRVALMLPTGEDFFYCFFGVLLAQAVPVPLYPPFRADRIADYAARQSGILRNAEAALLITAARGVGLARMLRSLVPGLLDVADAAELSAGDPGAWPAIPRGGELPALIQYTSGSTGDPKGVLLTHANLLANIRAVGRALAVGPADVAVSWLPLYHDMGLIGAWLMPLYYGVPITILSPLAFLRSPERWLWAIHARRGTLSIGPNFAYELCARKVRDDQLEGLDLSCWRAAMNGSEPVRPETIERFCARFASCGFRREAMMPVYGLAECTVGLAFPSLGASPRVDRIRRETLERAGRAEPGAEADALRFVSVGQPLDGHAIRLVDEQGSEVADRVQGRLQFRGPSVMSGYFRRPDATAAIRHGDWMDSGDVAYRAEGHLFITGRSKDVILKAGRNLYPQEIEAAVAEVDGVRRGCVAAFGIADPSQGTEKLLVAAETRETQPGARDALRQAIQARLLDAIGVPADDVVLLAPGLLPKTSSGKLRRAASRQAYLERRLDARGPSPARQWMALALAGAGRAVVGASRRAAETLYGAWVWALFIPGVVACWLAVLASPVGRRSAAAVRAFLRLWFRLAGVRVEVRGAENLSRGPVVVVANHSSFLDPLFLIAALPCEFACVAKQEVLDTPMLRTFIRKSGHVTVERGTTAESRSATEAIEAALARGMSVAVFPEGTFTRARGLRPFRLGAFKAAAATGCPIVPLAIRGSRFFFPEGRWLARRGGIEIEIRPPIAPQRNDWNEMVRLRDAAFAEILAACGEPRLEIVSAALPKGPSA